MTKAKTNLSPTELTSNARIALAEQAYREGRIIQRDWRRKRNGKELVCAMAAFGPDINSSGDCPADLMPPWLAELVPTLDDGIAASDVPWFMGELLAHVKRWHVFDKAAWEQVRMGFLIRTIQIAVDEAAKVQPEPAPAYWTKCLAAIEQVKQALAGNGDLDAARSAAWRAARSAEVAAARAATWRATEIAAWSATRCAANAASAAWSAWSAARNAAEIVASAAWGAWGAAESAAYRRIAEALFQVIDAELAA